MTTTAGRFVIEDYGDHDSSRVVVCTINVHIVRLVESVVRDGFRDRDEPRIAASQSAGKPVSAVWIATASSCSSFRERWKAMLDPSIGLPMNGSPG
jgi:hypothetical protein